MDLFSAEHQQAVSEQAKWHAIRDELKAKYGTHQDRDRATARHFLYKNKGFHKYGMAWTITMDDVRQICEIPSLPGSTRNNKNGAFFCTPDFAWTGHTHVSQVPGGHGNPIKIWTLSPKKFIEKFGRIPGGAEFARGTLDEYNRRAS